MPFIPIKKIKRGPGPRPPGDQPSLMAWVKKELWWLLSRTSVVVDWAVDYLGKVGVDATDEPDVAENKIVGSSTATVTKIGPDGYHQLQVAANSQTIIQQIPVAAPDPEATSKLLFPSLILDPLNMGNVTCVFGLETCGYQTFDSQWTQDGTAFVKDDAGALAATGDWFDGVDSETYGADGYSTLVGKLVITPPTSELSSADKKTAGVFVIEDTGAHYEGTLTYDPETGSYVGTSFVQTQARLRRVATLDESSEFIQYMTYYVEEGDNYAGFYAELQNAAVVLGTTEQSWTFASTHSWTNSYELLSSAQLTSRGASTVSTDMGITVSSPGTHIMSPVFSTPAGSPGITTLPAGPVTAWLKDVALSTSAKGNGTYNKIVAYLYDWDRASSYTPIVSWTSENIDWVNARDIEWEGTLSSDYSLAAGHAVVLRYYLYTDSTSSVAISFTYNSFDRYTKIEVPWSNAIFGGTNEHNELHGIDGGNPSATPKEFYHLAADEYAWLQYFSALPDNQTLRGIALLTSGTSWNPPSGATSVLVFCIGGGGQGGGANASAGEASVGSGGGAGGMSWNIVGCSYGTPVTYSIGAGGTGGGAGNNGNAGGATSWDSGSCIGYGGAGGVKKNSGTAVADTAGGLGGILSHIAGGNGGPAWTMSGTQGKGGDGGGSFLVGGMGGRGRVTYASAGTDGEDAYSKQYGAGGGGASAQDGTTAEGGDGAGGAILLFILSSLDYTP